MPSRKVRNFRPQLTPEGRAALEEEKPATQPVDASVCPNCRGTGLYYPEGYEKGVAKCRHENLPREGA